MAMAADYRKLAEECFAWARQSADESLRKHYRNMGQFWLECVARSELRSGAIAPSEPKAAQEVA